MSQEKTKQRITSIDVKIVAPEGKVLYDCRHNATFSTLNTVLRRTLSDVRLCKNERPEVFKDVRIDKPTAIDLIAAERTKQISKGYTVERDAAYTLGTGQSFADIANNLLNIAFDMTPLYWDKEIWRKLCLRPYKDRLRIAAAWMARALEIEIYLETKKEVPNGK